MSYIDPYGDPYAELDPEAAAELAYLLGGQSDILGPAAPYMSEAPYMNLAGLIPTDPDVLKANKSGLTYFQSLARSAMDPYLAGFAGAAGFAPGALEPRESITVVDRPNYRRVSALAQGDPDSYEGRIAQSLLQGYPASSALREIYTELDQYEPESDEWLAAVRRMALPTTQDQGATVLDEEDMRYRANELETSLFEDPQPGTTEAVYDPQTGELVSSGGERFIDPETGELMERVVEESPLAEHYREAGLPLPTDQFTPEMIMGPEWAAQSQALTREPVDAAEAAYWEAMQNYLDYEGPSGPIPNANPPRVEPAPPPDYDPLSAGWPGAGTSISEAGIDNTATVAAPGGGLLAPSTDVLDVIPGGAGMPAGSVQPAPGTPAAAVSEVIALGDASDLAAWMTQVYPTLPPEDRVAVDAIVATATPSNAPTGPAGQVVTPAMIAARRAGREDEEPTPEEVRRNAQLGAGLTPGVAPPIPVDPAEQAYLDYLASRQGVLPGAQNVVPPYAQPGAEQARRPGDVTYGPTPDELRRNAQLGGGLTPGVAPATPVPVRPGVGPPQRNARDDAMLAAILGGGLGAPPPAPPLDIARRNAQLGGGVTPGVAPATPAPVAPDQQQAYLDYLASRRGVLPGAQNVEAPPYNPLPSGAPRDTGEEARQRYLDYLGSRRGVVQGAQNVQPAAMTDAMLAAILPRAPRTGEERDEDRAQVLGGTTNRTGRRVRTGEEQAVSNQLLWDVADPRTEFLRQEAPRRATQARQAWMNQRRQYYDESARLYGKGSGFGRAMATAYTAQLRGVTPYLATVAARQQVPMAAGLNVPGRVY